MNGRAEAVVGEVLVDLGAVDTPFLATKVRDIELRMRHASVSASSIGSSKPPGPRPRCTHRAAAASSRRRYAHRGAATLRRSLPGEILTHLRVLGCRTTRDQC